MSLSVEIWGVPILVSGPCPGLRFQQMSNAIELDELRSHVRKRAALPAPAARRAIRTASGVTLDALGRAVGVSGESIRLYELGLRSPRGENLASYVNALETLQHELLNSGESEGP